MLQIRQATINDAISIALLGRVTFNDTFGHLFSDHNDLLDYLERTFSVAKISSSLEKDNNQFFIAFYNDLPVGYAKLKLDSTSEFLPSQKVCQLQKIYVLKDFLSKKIGKALQDSLLIEAQNKSFEKIWLSVYHENSRAISFYEKNGFKPIGTHGFQIGKEYFDFIAMAKPLQNG
ncbi:GNAT family N-acetyltransferase [Roseivirga sp.]|uniref:GNAT family N-acetyltransferase n=1 Tax=Roseivirga sp. TaxID=1964215 RepID=UPI003B528D2F